MRVCAVCQWLRSVASAFGVLSTGLPKAASYVAFPQAVSTNAEVDDETVYKMTKAVYESQTLLAKTFPPFRQFDPKKHMVGETGPAQYHPAAIKFYRQVGLWKK